MSGFIRRGVRLIAKNTLAGIMSRYPAATHVDALALATDIGPRGAVVKSNGVNWRALTPTAVYVGATKCAIIGGSGGTYSQSGTLVTVTWTAHGMTAAELNGARVYLTISTGAALSGWYDNLTIVDANTFAATAGVSRSTAGNLGTNTAETFIPITYTFPTAAGYAEQGDALSASAVMRIKTTANNKTGRIYLGSTAVVTTTQTSTANWSSVNTPSMLDIGGGVLIASPGAQITPANRICSVSGQLSNAADWLCLQFVRATISPGA